MRKRPVPCSWLGVSMAPDAARYNWRVHITLHWRADMAIPDVLLELRALSRIEKIRVIQFLASELENDASELIESGQSYPVWSPDRAFPAAAALLQALHDDKAPR